MASGSLSADEGIQMHLNKNLRFNDHVAAQNRTELVVSK